MDPFQLVQEEARSQLTDITKRVAGWQKLSQASSANERTSAETVKKDLLESISELQVDMSDMKATISIAENDPGKFQLTSEELKRRGAELVRLEAEVATILKQLKVSSAEATAAASRSGAAPELLRGGVASKPCTTSTQGPEAVVYTRSSGTRDHTNSAFARQQQHMVQELQTQDVALSQLSQSVGRLDTMGRVINKELREQGAVLDELSEEVEGTQARMRAATDVMKKMLKNKDNCKLLIILILSLTLAFLMFIVFDT